MKFKVGEQVMVSKNLHDGMKFGVNERMMRMRGNIVTIAEVEDYRHDGLIRYEIKEDGGNYNWSNKMLEPIALSAEEAFEALLHGRINEERYTEMVEEKK